MKSPNRFFKLIFLIAALLLALLLISRVLLDHFDTLFGGTFYDGAHFHIETLKSPLDADGDGMDDFRDLLLGARAYVNTRPNYENSYESGGYPKEGVGVCTDVIWQAFQAAGYDLKALVDADIAAYPAAYPDIETPDPNIDFRRVKNLNVFFRRHAQSLSTDLSDPALWQPGDIVVYPEHIAIVSDRRNEGGIPFIIHHNGQPLYESNDLAYTTITAHYRWVPQDID